MLCSVPKQLNNGLIHDNDDDSLSFICIQCALETQYWTWINHFFTWGSIILFMLIQIVLYADKLTFADFLYEYMGVTPQVNMRRGTHMV